MKHTRFLSVLVVVALAAAAAFAFAGCAKKAEKTTTTPPAVEQPAVEPEASEPATDQPVVDQAEGEALVEGACTGCHDVQRIYNQTEYMDWVGTIARMKSAHGAVLTDEQEEKIAAFLESRQ